MDRRPVGVFDSGLGGISVLGEMLDVLPEENFVYYGDTRNVPYGDKRPEEVLRLTHLAVDRLIAMDCKAVVIACNTATSAAAGPLRQELHMPVIGMEPALKPASLLPGGGYVVVMATHMTLTQPKFLRLMERYGQNALPVPCPGLMECVEAGAFSGPRVESLLDRLLSSVRGLPVKAVVLGCTHYPFLRGAISRCFAPGTPLIDGNLGTARQLRPPAGGGGPPLPRTGRRGDVSLLAGGRGGGGAHAAHAQAVAGNDGARVNVGRFRGG